MIWDCTYLLISWGQFHQHFMHAFFIQECFAQLSLVMFQLCNFWRQNIDRVKCWCNGHLGSISPTFFACIFCTNIFFSSYVLFCSYEKRAWKTLVKLTPGLNFINVLCTTFMRADPESVMIQSIPQYLLCFWDLWAQKLYVKTLMKLTRGFLNF